MNATGAGEYGNAHFTPIPPKRSNDKAIVSKEDQDVAAELGGSGAEAIIES